MADQAYLNGQLVMDSKQDLANALVQARNALNEVTTNGRWTEGEQRGEWAITNEVYETARDALAPAPTGREPR